MPLSLSVFSQSGPPICTPIWAFFRAFKALRALKGPLIKFSHILMHRPYRDILYLKFSCLYLFPFSHKVVPQKASGGGGGGSGVGGGSGGSYTTLQLVNILSQNAKRASARKDTGLDQSLFSVQLFRLRINPYPSGLILDFPVLSRGSEDPCSITQDPLGVFERKKWAFVSFSQFYNMQ